MAAGLVGSQLFCPFRALGFVANHVPLTLQTQGTETLVTTAVGSAFHVYNVRLFWVVSWGKLNQLHGSSSRSTWKFVHRIFEISHLTVIILQCAKLNLLFVGKLNKILKIIVMAVTSLLFPCVSYSKINLKEAIEWYDIFCIKFHRIVEIWWNNMFIITWRLGDHSFWKSTNFLEKGKTGIKPVIIVVCLFVLKILKNM